METRFKAIRPALHETPTIEKELGATADTLEQRNREILRVLRGDQEFAKRNEPVPSSINDRVNSIMEAERFALTKATQTYVYAYNNSAREFTKARPELTPLLTAYFVKVRKGLATAGTHVRRGRFPA